MSLGLAQAWINSACRNSSCAREAMKGFARAAADGVGLTLIMAPQLMKNGKCCLVHWTGEELIVLELSSRQRRAFGIEPGMLLQEFEPRQELPEPPTIRRANLLEVRIDGPPHFDAWQPLTGKFKLDLLEPASGPIERCALRMKYFRPGAPVGVTLYSHTHGLLPVANGQSFSFVPLNTDNFPEQAPGPAVLFFQLVTASDWGGRRPGECMGEFDDIQRISNVLARVVEIQ